MKILHICTMDTPGAGGSVLRLHRGLKSLGLDSKMLVQNRTSCDKDVIAVDQDSRSIIETIARRLRSTIINMESSAFKQPRLRDSDLFTGVKSPYRLSKHALIKEADIINLHWIATMVDYNDFFPAMRNKPIVWTLHDKNPFTGGCHVSGECTRYQMGCGLCPQLGSVDPHDLSRRIFLRKEKHYRGTNMSLIVASRYQANCVKKSALLKNFPIHVIPQGVATSVFKKSDKQLSRKRLNLPQDKTLIFFGTYYRSKSKGFEYLQEALKLLEKKINFSQAALIILGPTQNLDHFSKNTKLSIHQLGFIHDQTLLSFVYSSVDIVVIPSLEESFGLICLESMACGTPVVGFSTGGMQDMIIPHKTGLIAELKNTKDLTDKIEYMIKYPQEREQMGKNARKLVEEEYTLRIQAKRYLKLYRLICSAKGTSVPDNNPLDRFGN